MHVEAMLKRITTYAETHANAQTCRTLAAHTAVPADRANLVARADWWTQGGGSGRSAGRWCLRPVRRLRQPTTAGYAENPDRFGGQRGQQPRHGPRRAFHRSQRLWVDLPHGILT